MFCGTDEQSVCLSFWPAGWPCIVVLVYPPYTQLPNRGRRKKKMCFRPCSSCPLSRGSPESAVAGCRSFIPENLHLSRANPLLGLHPTVSIVAMGTASLLFPFRLRVFFPSCTSSFTVSILPFIHSFAAFRLGRCDSVLAILSLFLSRIQYCFPASV